MSVQGNHRVPDTQDTQIISRATTQSVAEDKSVEPFQELTPVFLPYSQTIMDRINKERSDKDAHEEEYDLDTPQASERRVSCECGASSDEGFSVSRGRKFPE